MHALTGCDSTSNLNGIGKKGGFTALKKHKDDLVGLNNLGTNYTVMSDETLTVCFQAPSNLNHFRYKLFTKKHLESSKLPPTEDSALFHVKRANYHCFIWKHARDRRLSLTSPVGNGWTKGKMGHLVPKLMERSSPRKSLGTDCVQVQKWMHARCSFRRVGLSFTAACTCVNECSNLQKNDEDDEL